jgi:hypothetical protein
VPLPGIEPQFPGHRAHSLVILTEISKLSHGIYVLINLSPDVTLYIWLPLALCRVGSRFCGEHDEMEMVTIEDVPCHFSSFFDFLLSTPLSIHVATQYIVLHLT